MSLLCHAATLAAAASLFLAYHTRAARTASDLIVHSLASAVVSPLGKAIQDREPESSDCERLLAVPGIKAALVREVGGAVVASAAEGAAYERALREASTPDRPRGTPVQTRVGAGIGAIRTRVVVLPLDRGSGRSLEAAVMWSDAQAGSAVWAGAGWLGAAVLLALPACAVVMAWSRRRIFDPLRDLAAATGTDDFASMHEMAERLPNEIGAVASVLDAAHGRALGWRNRVMDMHRSIDSTVASRTEQIAHELSSARQAMTLDPLTGLRNRRALEGCFDQILEAQRDSRGNLAVVMIDVDNFKALNDTMGHPDGDRLLSFLGSLLRQSIRESDVAVRYGGDEFLLLLPGASRNAAERLVQRIRALFNQYVTLIQGVPAKPALSFGVAMSGEDPRAGAAELLALADQRMYAMKSGGSRPGR